MDGKLVLTLDNGNSGRSDGHVDTVTVVDIEANPPRVIDKVVVGDSPEGFVVNPNGRMAVAILLGGSDGPKNSWFYNRNGSVVTLKIDGKKIAKTGEVRVGGIPEGAVFSPDGRWLYVGNYADKNISVLRVDGDTVVDTGVVVALPGSPASMRGRVQ
jgi:DNA-binding beta-propeller fold protein YncE